MGSNVINLLLHEKARLLIDTFEAPLLPCSQGLFDEKSLEITDTSSMIREKKQALQDLITKKRMRAKFRDDRLVRANYDRV